MGWDTAIISGAFLIVGTCPGAFLSHRFAKSSQREQWILDNRKQEYRELLTTLTNTYMLIVARSLFTTAYRYIIGHAVSERFACYKPGCGSNAIDANQADSAALEIAQNGQLVV
jgi:hypothetical protein